MSTGVKVVIIIVVVVVLLGLTCVGGVIGLGVWAASQGPPEGIVLDARYPASVEVGQTFDMVVTVSNQTDRPRTLLDLDFYPNLLGGVTIDAVDPRPNRDEEMISRTLSFNRTIPGESDLVITLTMTPTTPGTWSGDLDVTMDKLLSMPLSTQQTIVVTPAP